MADEVSGQALAAWLREFARRVREHRDELTRLDSAIGDADHGTNMDRGMTAVVAAIDALGPATAGALFKKAGTTLVSTVGGASGPLYGTFFLRLAAAVGEVDVVTTRQLAVAFRAGLEGVIARGKAQTGEKTMVDALSPAIEALDEAAGRGASTHDALEAAHAAAEQGRDATTPMQARKGRASYLGERSVGHQDPGATSVELLLAAAVHTLG